MEQVRLHEQRSSIVGALRAFRWTRFPLLPSSRALSPHDWSKKAHIISRNKNQKQKIAYTKLFPLEEKETWNWQIFYLLFRLSYMFGINKNCTNLQILKKRGKKKLLEKLKCLNRNSSKKFIQILSLMALYDRGNMNGTTDSMAHFYGTTTMYTKS